jgi:hypothetical protein
MQDRRLENRLLCADLVRVWWREASGTEQQTLANLEDISLSGACLQFDRPIRRGTLLHIALPKGELQGGVKYCVFRDVGYFVGIRFEAGCKLSRRDFKPKHLLDLRSLVDKKRRA